MRNGLARIAAVMTATGLMSEARSETLSKADNADALNLTSSWVQGKVPGTNDVATWDATLTAGKTYIMGADLSWRGLAFVADPNGNVTFNVGNTLTLGADGINSTPNRTITLNNAITLASDQSWSMGQSTITFGAPINTAGYTLALGGGGSKQFKGAITGGGSLALVKGNTKFSNGSVATASAITVSNSASLTFDATPAAGGAARAASVTLRGAGADTTTRAALTSTGVNNANTLDIISEALTIDVGHAFVTASPNASKPLVLNAGSLVHSSGATALLRGTDLGVATIASATSGKANISFTAAPALTGGGGSAGSTTISILPWAYGDITSAGNGTALVTYDSTYGIRLLSTNNEYTAVITNGQTQLDNVRYVNTSGSGINTTTLTQDSVINSLSFEETGVGTNTGIQIIGDVLNRQLTLSSGTIFSRQTVASAQASDATIISNLTLNLNGQEGIFVSHANGLNQGNTPAALFIYAAITNDGGKGVTFGTIGGGNGEIYLAGSATNTYTGPTVLNSGNLRLSKTPASISIPGNLIINGGAIIKSSEAIPDTADVTLNGGALYFDNTTSSGNNNHVETIRNLYMNGGAISFNAGKNHTFNINGNAVINTGDLRLNTGGDVKVLGTTTLNGGRVLVSLSDSTTAFNALFTLNDLVITNQVMNVYTSVVLKADATNKGGKLTLGGTVTFVGNTVNTNASRFDSENITLAQQGVIALDGIRPFNIGDGAAATDLVIIPVMSDNGATAGGLIKTGEGTLSLSGTNAYSGATTVSNGTLAVNGGLISSVTVCSNAVLTGTGWISPAGNGVTVSDGGILDPGAPGSIGTLTVTGGVRFVASAQLRVDVGATGADLLAVSGNVVSYYGGPITVNVVGSGNGPWLILTATAISADFTTSAPGLVVSKRNNTEVWLGKRKGTLISVY